MSDQPLLERIAIDPAIMDGQPVIRGTRLTVEFIHNLLVHGTSISEILREYTGLSSRDILACELFSQQAAITLRTGERVNLTRLANWLLSHFSLRQLRRLAGELGLTPGSFGMDNATLKKEAVVSMVSRIVALHRLDDLTEICARWDASFNPQQLDFPNADWTPKPLPATVIDAVNRTLSTAGHPYFTLTPPGFENQWTPKAIDTGCFCWPLILDVVPEILSGEPGLLSLLTNVRQSIVEDNAFAYFGIEQTWGGNELSLHQPCIVVAPTVDQFDTVRIEQTAPTNLGLDTAEFIQELKLIDEKYGLDILAADNGTVEIRLVKMAQRQKASFSRWLKEFAPLAYDEYKAMKPQANQFPPIRLYWD